MVLEAQSLEKIYGNKVALSSVSFRIGPGEVLGCVGLNGAGKSTTVRIVTGLIAPTSGQVFFEGIDIRKDMNRYKARLGYVPEEAHIYPYLCGQEYVELVTGLRALDKKVAASKISALLELFELAPHRHCLVSSYSKGMRQKLLVISALIHNPDILVLDEPFRCVSRLLRHQET